MKWRNRRHPNESGEINYFAFQRDNRGSNCPARPQYSLLSGRLESVDNEFRLKGYHVVSL